MTVQDKPVFTGAFAAELDTAWEQSKSDFVREVIRDQVISDQEWAEVTTRIAACLAQYGMDFKGFDGDGAYSLEGNTLEGEELEQALSGCESVSGESWINGLRRSMSTNPDNIPFEQLMTECLKRNGLVSADYTEEQFLRDNPSQSFPFMGSPKEDIFWSCNSNPAFQG